MTDEPFTLLVVAEGAAVDLLPEAAAAGLPPC